MPNITITQNSTSPSVADTIQFGGVVTNLTGSTVRFRMRGINSAVLKVDSVATIVSPTAGTVRYDWASADTNTDGDYIAWWHIILSGGQVQQSPEFKVFVDAHSPGVDVVTGEIADQARQLMPETWDALSRSEKYGDRMLKTRTDYVKYKLFATIVSATIESTVYNPMILDYVAKEVALQIIPAGIDFWMNAKTSVESERETITYPDRLKSLEKLNEWLILEVAKLRQDLNDQFVVRHKGNFPKVGNALDLITPNPQEFGSLFSEGIPKNLPAAF